MRNQILFIHGAGEGAYKEDKILAASLQNLLGASYDIRYPVMENEDDAAYETWARQIEQELAALSDSIILVGHSVGASVLIKFLSENKVKKTVKGIFLIATPFWGGENGWTYEDFETLMLPNEGETILPQDVPLFFYHSHDDEVVPFNHVTLYSNRFPRAKIRELYRRGHQLRNDLSEVADDIKKLQK